MAKTVDNVKLKSFVRVGLIFPDNGGIDSRTSGRLISTSISVLSLYLSGVDYHALTLTKGRFVK